MTFSRAGVAALLAFSHGPGTGCESVRVGANPELPLWVHRPSGAMNLVFSRRVLAPARVVGEPYERGQPEIDVAGRRVFVGSSDRGLYALSAEDGSVIWRFETLGFVQCEPLYDPQGRRRLLRLERRRALQGGGQDGAAALALLHQRRGRPAPGARQRHCSTSSTPTTR